MLEKQVPLMNPTEGKLKRSEHYPTEENQSLDAFKLPFLNCSDDAFQSIALGWLVFPAVHLQFKNTLFLCYRSSSRSTSRSQSPENAGKVEFITEFSHPSADQPSKTPGGDSHTHSSSSRSVCFTLLSARTIPSSIRLTVRKQSGP